MEPFWYIINFGFALDRDVKDQELEILIESGLLLPFSQKFIQEQIWIHWGFQIRISSMINNVVKALPLHNVVKALPLH